MSSNPTIEHSELSSAKNETVISVRNVDKAYRIWRDPAARLKAPVWDMLGSIIPAKLRPKALSKRLGHEGSSRYYRDFYALKDVSFDVEKGSIVGILGRNGSGKSTLLQIICGTLSSTAGAVTSNGRIAALLELGSGFNPEFTGRENIILNAAILGVPRKIMESRLKSVIEFSGLGDFVDQPAKTYSSGMFARLAFSSAVHVDPSILIVDEALAVGDSGFQLKCMLKMDELKRNGTTILFVSHDTSSVARLCNRAIVLDQGSIIANSLDVLSCIRLYDKISRKQTLPSGSTTPVTTAQQSTDYQAELQGIEEKRLGNGLAQYVSVDFLTPEGTPKNVFEAGSLITISALIQSHSNFNKIVSGFTLKNKSGVDVWGDNNIYANVPLRLQQGHHRLNYTFHLNIAPGEYFLYIGLADIENARIELDQRWPVRRLSITSSRQTLGQTFAPASISLEPENITT